MRKYILLISMTLLLVFLAACGGDNNEKEAEAANNNNENNVENNMNTNDENNENEGNENDAAVDGLSAKEVFEKTAEANETIESFSASTDTKQDMNLSGTDTTLHTKADLDFIMDPIALKQTTVVEGVAPEPEEMETYMTEDGYYMHSLADDEWIKFPDELSSSMFEQILLQADMETQMEQFNGMEDNFTVDEADDHYELHFSTNDEEDSEKILETAQASLPNELGQLGDELLQGMTINEAEYKMIIDKDTFYVKEMDIFLEFDMELEGEEISSKQEMSMIYSNYNEVEEIVVPDEAIDNAEELEL